MDKFHIDKNGNPALCKATIRECPVGGEHYNSIEEARRGYEKSHEGQLLKSFNSRSENKSKSIGMPNFSEKTKLALMGGLTVAAVAGGLSATYYMNQKVNAEAQTTPYSVSMEATTTFNNNYVSYHGSYKNEKLQDTSFQNCIATTMSVKNSGNVYCKSKSADGSVMVSFDKQANSTTLANPKLIINKDGKWLNGIDGYKGTFINTTNYKGLHETEQNFVPKSIFN